MFAWLLSLKGIALGAALIAAASFGAGYKVCGAFHDQATLKAEHKVQKKQDKALDQDTTVAIKDAAEADKRELETDDAVAKTDPRACLTGDDVERLRKQIFGAD